jgi:addiction module RelE/StbE family toxin
MNSKNYQVFWTQTAQRDLKEIIQYIALDSPDQAKDIYTHMKDKACGLRQMPLQGRIVPELFYFGILIYRELVITPWRLIYKIEENKVWVLAVINGRRNVEDILLNRFIYQ